MEARLAVIAISAACIAGAIYAFRVGTGQTYNGQANSHAHNQAGDHADHHAATSSTPLDSASAAAAKINPATPPSPAPDDSDLVVEFP